MYVNIRALISRVIRSGLNVLLEEIVLIEIF